MIPREGILNVFAKKSRTHTTARSNAAACILVDARGNGRGRTWELKSSERRGAYLNARCATLGNKAWASFALPAELVREIKYSQVYTEEGSQPVVTYIL